MNMSAEEYHFYEWLIIEKHMSEEKFKKLTDEEFTNLKIEFIEFYKRIK